MPKLEVFGGWLFGFFKLSFPSGRSGEACPKAQAPRPRQGGEHGWREAVVPSPTVGRPALGWPPSDGERGDRNRAQELTN